MTTLRAGAGQEARYGLPAILLHWLNAVLVIGLIALGYYMVDLPRGTPSRGFFINLHKSFGLLVGLLVLVRAGWRSTHPPPPLPDSMPAWQRSAAQWSHRALYACLVLQPATGYISSSFNRFGVSFFGIALPQWGWEDKPLRELFIGMHHAVAVVLTALIVVHVLAALGHLLYERDRVFQRMLP